MTRKLGRVVFIRHGESIWNITDPDRGLVTRFTGWVDVALTDRGRLQAAAAGRCLKMFGVYPDAIFTSNLKRSKDSNQVMKDNDPEMFDVQVANSWRLNERHYGSLVGLSKEEAGDKMGHNIVMGWRRSWDLKPPGHVLNKFEWSNAEWTKPKTTVTETGKQTLIFIEKNITMPTTESLKDCALRVKPIWVNFIAPRIAEGETVLVVAHANSIRSMIKHIDEATMSVENLKNVHIPSATPLLYCFTTKDNTAGNANDEKSGNTTTATTRSSEVNNNSAAEKLLPKAEDNTDISSNVTGNVVPRTPDNAAARNIRPMGQPTKLGMTGRYLVNREVIKLALESSVTIKSTDNYKSIREVEPALSASNNSSKSSGSSESAQHQQQQQKDKVHFFDLIDKNISEILNYSNCGNGKDEALLITDGRGHILHVNETFEAKTGFLNEDVKGRTAKFLQGPQTKREQLSKLDEKLRTGLPATDTLINYYKNGIAFENQMTIIPIFDWLPTMKGNSCSVVRLPAKQVQSRVEDTNSTTTATTTTTTTTTSSGDGKLNPNSTNSHVDSRDNDDAKFRTSSGLYMHPSHFIARYEMMRTKVFLQPLTADQIAARGV